MEAESRAAQERAAAAEALATRQKGDIVSLRAAAAAEPARVLANPEARPLQAALLAMASAAEARAARSSMGPVYTSSFSSLLYLIV